MQENQEEIQKRIAEVERQKAEEREADRERKRERERTVETLLNACTLHILYKRSL